MSLSSARCLQSMLSQPTFEIYFNIFLPSAPTSLKWYIALTSPPQIYIYIYLFIFCHIRATCPGHLILLDQPIVWWRVQILKLLVTHFSPLSRCFVPVSTKQPAQHPVPEHMQSVRFPQPYRLNDRNDGFPCSPRCSDQTSHSLDALTAFPVGTKQ